ncbi:hypothetical protein K449DRAFT_110836 [Hypoxylon sp. EC38]|nr:hypothetical protein K449DRAFT_110836 [Hypoxylon sp. EC38]
MNSIMRNIHKMVDGKPAAKQHISTKRPFDDINDDQFSGSTAQDARHKRARIANDVAPDVQLSRRATRSRANALTRQLALEEARQRALNPDQQLPLTENQQVQQQHQETALVAILKSLGLGGDRFIDKLVSLIRQENGRDARSPSMNSICSANSERSIVSTGSHNPIDSISSTSNLTDFACVDHYIKSNPINYNSATPGGGGFLPREPEKIEWEHFKHFSWDKGATNGPPSEPKSPRTI